jgi:S-DNA-T family DNA segregation ATPase FtsK/SpoIIIE
VLGLLDELKAAAQEFSTAKGQVEEEFQARSVAENRAYESSVKNQAQAATERTQRAEASAIEAIAQCNARFAQRKTRINEIHKRLRRKASEDITEYEGKGKGRLQLSAMEAQKNRDAGLSAAAVAHDEFRQKLVESERAYAALEAAAAKVFGGAGGFRKRLAEGEQGSTVTIGAEDEHQIFDRTSRLYADLQERLKRSRRRLLPGLFRILPIWLLIFVFLVAGGTAPIWLPRIGGPAITYQVGAIGGAVASFLVLALYLLSRSLAGADARSFAGDLLNSRALHAAAFVKTDQRLELERERIKAEFQTRMAEIDSQYKAVVKEAIDLRDRRPRELDEKAGHAAQHNERLHEAQLQSARTASELNAASLRQQIENEARQLTESHELRMKRFHEDRDTRTKAFQERWTQAAVPVLKSIEELNAVSGKLFPDWQGTDWNRWTPPGEFENAAKFGQLDINLQEFANLQTLDEQLPRNLSLPLLLTYPNEGSILLEAGKGGHDAAITAINNVMFRLLSSTPPGKVSFTIFDPIGLGQNFAGLMHLADYEESHISSRIWTQTGQMEEKLGELSEHMEKVIQMYLRNEYETIAEYNAQAGAIAEKYHFLVIASFPANFSDTAAKRLRNIAASGARCGVYTLIHWDQRQPVPQDFVPDELRKNSVRLVFTERGYEFAGRSMQGTRLMLDAPPAPELATDFLHRVGQFSKDSNRVEVPFREIAPPDNDLWKEETTEELRVPIGRSGATKLQYLAIGKGTRQHALIAGKTGSGKSTLFHVMITNLALWCSPDQVEFYLVDFKKGVEFKCYGSRRLPHARVVAIESDRQFGLSVLERVDAELRRRGDLFRKLGVQDIPGYKRAGGNERMPRSLLMIDEFQEFFTEEDRISQSAAVLLDRIVRQGRAFGIHVILGSQTLGGAYTLARATLGQMVIRIALQCNEADAYLIMDQDNPAPRLLSRPGEGIYNDSAGAIEGNSPFQAVWLSEDVRDEYLVRARELADQTKNGHDYPGPFVFEGNAPADVRENLVLNQALQMPATTVPDAGRIWLGAPNSIKGPTEVVFQKQGGNNLMVVGQNEEATLAILSVSLVSLSSQYPRETVRLILLDSAVPDSPQAEFLGQVIGSLGHKVERPKGNAGLTQVMGELAAELQRRSGEDEESAADGKATPIFLIIYGLENFKKLRQEDEFSFGAGGSESGPNPAAVLQTLITEGPSHGIHVFITCDSFNNISRFLGRKALSEFASRVLFQMSASDSAALIDSPDASTLGLHRALLYNDREGYTEVFRPYARPGNEWIEQVAASLAPRLQPA